MEFWGLEVKAGEPVVVSFDDDQILHLSQATLGESKKGSERVVINLKFGDQKLVLGSLSAEKLPQLMFDLVFEKEFELSHTSKSGSVYFMGYKTYVNDDEDEDDYSDYSDPEDAIPIETTGSGKIEEPKAAKPNGNPIVQSKENAPTTDSDEDSEDDDVPEDSDEEISGAESDESGEDESGSDDSEDDEEIPKKAEVGKKRPNDSATKTPVSAKKAKVATPQKTDGKKAGHASTPYPKQAGNPKQAGKSPTSKAGKSPKAFKTEAAKKQSHSAAKHK